LEVVVDSERGMARAVRGVMLAVAPLEGTTRGDVVVEGVVMERFGGAGRGAAVGFCCWARACEEWMA
jgi:hypothetical protein